MRWSLLFITAVFTFSSAIVGAPIHDNVHSLHQRAVTPQFTFSGDLANIVIPAPLPAGSSAKDVKKQNAKIAKAKANQATRAQLQATAQTKVSTTLTAASGTLQLSGNLPVEVTNNFHSSKADAESHVTFKFTAPPCGGECVGHAYNPVSTVSPGKGQPGKIFSASHAVIFGGSDI